MGQRIDFADLIEDTDNITQQHLHSRLSLRHTYICISLSAPI